MVSRLFNGFGRNRIVFSSFFEMAEGQQPPPNQQQQQQQSQSQASLLKYLEEFQFPFMEDVSKYDKIIKIGQGTFGYVIFIKACESCFEVLFVFREVFKAKCKTTGRIVALKKILMENEKEGVS